MQDDDQLFLRMPRDRSASVQNLSPDARSRGFSSPPELYLDDNQMMIEGLEAEETEELVMSYSASTYAQLIESTLNEATETAE